MSEWITDRMPTKEDANHYGEVWITNKSGVTKITDYVFVGRGQPWMVFTHPDPYVKPKHYYLSHNNSDGEELCVKWRVHAPDGTTVAHSLPTREAAQHVADAYNEVMS